MPALRIFEKSVHRIPTLALYKSLLKLSSSPVLDHDLSTRLKEQIRHGFKSNLRFSTRLTKRGLVKAFQVHATIERAITGDKSALDTLLESCPPHSAAEPLLPLDLPSPPPRATPLIPNIIKPPTIHYPQVALPRMYLPLMRQPPRLDRLFARKMKFFRHLLASHTFHQLMLYHLVLEESFLADLQYDSEINLDLEAGVREVKGITVDLEKMLNHTALMEDITVMWELKEWLRQHPRVGFTKVGKRMTLARRRELKSWRADVKRLTRQSAQDASTKKFMTNWQRTVPLPAQVTEFRVDHQNRLKRKAKKIRKRKMGIRFL